MVVKTITGIAPAMVVLMLGRELLVTSLRGICESSGQNFGANLSGKLKMIIQSVTILVILIYVNYHVWLKQHGYETWTRNFELFRNITIWLTIVITVWSGLIYIQRAIEMFKGSAEVKT